MKLTQIAALPLALVSVMLATSSAPAFSNLGSNVLQSDGSAADTQAAINSASNGYTVQIPAGSFNWTSAVTISGKAITLAGAGSGRVLGQSTSSVSISTGSKTFTTQSGLNISSGQTLKIYRTGGIVSGGNPTGVIGWMQGTVTSYSGTTLTMSISSVNGSGTHPVWIITNTANTTITHSAGASMLLSLTESTAGNIEVSGLRFVTGSATAPYVYFAYNSGKPILFHDCYFESTVNFDCIRTNSNSGVIWNCSFVALPFSMAQLAVHHKDAPPNSWSTPSTMGMADVTGTNNLYVEDCDFHGWLNAVDIDDNGRAVMRHCLFNNAGFGTHGADTSDYGVRHYEVYDNQFVFNGFSDGNTLNLNWFFFLRGGTGVIADNAMPHITSQDYGSKLDINMTVMNLQRNAGRHPCWGAGIAGNQYPAPRQVGMGYVTGRAVTDAVSYTGDSEPLYIWNNTGGYQVGTSDFGGSDCSSPDSSANYIVSGRDYFNGTAKPGYIKYTYPHPLHSSHSSGTPTPTPLPTILPPSNGVISAKVT